METELEGKDCVVTGANSGIGKELARELAQAGARVFMVCRNLDKGQAALEELAAKTGSERLELLTADVSSLASIRAFAEDFEHRTPKVDVLMNNAGIYLPKRMLSVDGHEMMFATNHLGAFLLTQLLLPKLTAAPHARVVTTSSMGHKMARLDWDDLECERRFGPLRQYGSTKLMNILFTRELSRREPGLAVSCFHPGPVATNFAQQEPGFFGKLVKLGSYFLRTPKQGADTGAWLARSDEGGQAKGGYYVDRHEAVPSPLGRDDEAAAKLWQTSAEMTAA